MTTQLVFVSGTWGSDWAHAESPFCQMLEAKDFAPIRFQGWTENLDGVPNILSKGRKHRDWIAGGYALAYFLSRLDYLDRNLIAHSHGINPVLYAPALTKIKIRRLISICSPVRADMDATATEAVTCIERWRHVASIDWDFMQWAGEMLDGHLQLTRERRWRQATENVYIKGIGHSNLFKPPWFDRWEQDGMLDMLRVWGTDAIHLVG